MKDTTIAGSALLGAFICLGLAAFGYLISNAVITHKLYDRHVTVKGLSEREYNADIVIWPIQFTVADNDLTRLYNAVDDQSEKIRSFLGAEYVYEEETPSAISGTEDITVPKPGALACLPRELISQLHEAAINGDFHLLVELVGQVESRDMHLAGVLRTLAGKFDTQRILDLLEQDLVHDT